MKDNIKFLKEQLDVISRSNHTIAHALGKLDLDYRRFRGHVETMIQTIMLAEAEGREAKIKADKLLRKIKEASEKMGDEASKPKQSGGINPTSSADGKVGDRGESLK